MYDDLHFLPFSLNQEYLGDDDSYYNHVSYRGNEFSEKQTEELDKTLQKRQNNLLFKKYKKILWLNNGF